MNISAKTKLCIVIGNPIDQSLSPNMHNAGYAALGIDDQFIFLGANVLATDLKNAIAGLRAMHARGITVTHPHKITVMEYLDEIDPTAEKIGAVNTVVNDQGKLIGYNTDWLGVVTPLEKFGNLQGKKVAILGAGGAAKAAGFGLTQKQAHVTIFNRTLETATVLAKKIGGQAKSLADIAEIKDADIIFNATPVGDNSLVPQEYMRDTQIVFDAVYAPFETQLLQHAKAKGATIIHGTDMLLYQGLAQFELYTKQKAPEDVMRKILMEHIPI